MTNAELPPKSALELQIDQERTELEAVPKIPISHFTAGRASRCSLCGRVCNEDDLLEFDTQVPNSIPRKACPDCHPNRGHQ